MGVLFDDASSERAVVSASVLSAGNRDGPFTMFGWGRPDALPDDVAVMTLGHSSSNAYHEILFRSTGAGRGRTRNSAFAQASTTANTISTNTWGSLVYIVTSATSRRCVLNGDWANSGTNTTDTTLSATPDLVEIGSRADAGTVAHYFSGVIGLCGWFDFALNQNQAQALGKGASPYSIGAGPAEVWLLVKDGTSIRAVKNHSLDLALTGGTASALDPSISPIFPIGIGRNTRVPAAAAGGYVNYGQLMSLGVG